MTDEVTVTPNDSKAWLRALAIYETGFNADGLACSPEREIARYRASQQAVPNSVVEDVEFLRELADRMFNRLTPAMGFDQGDTDRLYRIATTLQGQTAPAGDVVEAVACRWRYRYSNGKTTNWTHRAGVLEPQEATATEAALEVEPLYLTAAKPQDAELLREVSKLLKAEAVHMEYDWPGDAEVECGLWCRICADHVEDDHSNHAPNCLIARIDTRLSGETA